MSTVGRRGPRRRSVPMPVSGQLPRLGKIRLGVGIETGKVRYGKAVVRPKAVDYFLVAEDESGITSPEAAAAFARAYPEQPRQLRCMLPGRRPGDVFEGAWRLYGASKLKVKCDGQTCDVRLAAGGWAYDQPCLCRDRTEDDPDRCTLTYTLQVLLPDVEGVGVWQIDTGSEISARRVADFLELIYQVRGDLALYEFTLGLVPVSVAPDGTSKTVYVLDPRAHAVTPRQMLEGATAVQRPVAVIESTGEVVDLPALPAPAADDDDGEDELLSRQRHADADADDDDVPAEDTPPAQSAEGPPGELFDVVKAQYARLKAPHKAALRALCADAGIAATAAALVATYGERCRNLPGFISAYESEQQRLADGERESA